MFEEFVRKQKVLQLIADRTREGKETSFKSLVREFDLSIEAACQHLKRLWEGRLIEVVSYRPGRFQFRLEAGESIRSLRFLLSERGRDRLRRWKEVEKKDEGWLL